MTYRALIVDDEQHQQEMLSGLIRKNLPDIELTGVCSSMEEGIKGINELNPHLVFLDVVIPPYTAFDLLEKVNNRNFDIIFMSSYERYAVNAFKVSAVDYLLKPFGIEELAAAYQRFEEKRRLRLSFEHISTLLNNIRSNTSSDIRIALPTQTGYHFVRLGDVIRCEADNNYTKIFLIDKSTLLVSRSIRECEELLTDYNFFRVHHSHLINLAKVKEYIRGDGGQVRFIDGSLADVSRSKKDDFLEVLQKL